MATRTYVSNKTEIAHMADTMHQAFLIRVVGLHYLEPNA